MKKFGFGKKKEEDEDTKRSALFGSRSKGDAPPSGGGNPYAQANPYAPDKSNVSQEYSSGRSQGPPSYSSSGHGSMDSYRQEKSPVPPGGYSGGSSYGGMRGYGNSNSNYGDSRSGQSRGDAGGYGGLGSGNNNDDSNDTGRAQLFANARPSAPGQSGQPGQGGYGQGSYGQGGGYGPGGYGEDRGPSYGTYNDRKELTAEEQEEEDVQAMKSEIKDLTRDTKATSGRVTQTSAQTLAMARQTYGMVIEQGDRLDNASRRMNASNARAKEAHASVKTLEKTNNSMFYNPGTRSRVQKAVNEEQRIRREEKEGIEGIDKFGVKSTGRSHEAPKYSASKAKAKNNQYNFENDSEDDENNAGIDNDIEETTRNIAELKFIARGIGSELDRQTELVQSTGEKVDEVNERLGHTGSRMKRIN